MTVPPSIGLTLTVSLGLPGSQPALAGLAIPCVSTASESTRAKTNPRMMAPSSFLFVVFVPFLPRYVVIVMPHPIGVKSVIAAA